MDLTEWYCAAGHTIERYPDDGRDRHSSRRRRARIAPTAGTAPGTTNANNGVTNADCRSTTTE
jgi:hypothetical protein